MENNEYQTVAWGLNQQFGQEGGSFTQMNINRANATENYVNFEVLYCGICHSDVMNGLNEMGVTKYPLVPGHEFIGVVKSVGDKVTKVKVGDHVGVGVIVDSCLDCKQC